MSLRKQSQNSKRYAYNDVNVKKARNLIEGMNADFGGTEIFQPLESAFKCALNPNEKNRVFLLTDGQVSNSEKIYDLIKKFCDPNDL